VGGQPKNFFIEYVRNNPREPRRMTLMRVWLVATMSACGAWMACAAHATAYEQEPAAADVVLGERITNSIGMDLKLIPAGEFLMGTAGAAEDDEQQHRVRITRPFYMGVYEVTQVEYRKVMGKNPSYFSATGKSSANVEGMNTLRFPVDNVTWDDAVRFCQKLSATEGRTYRLPTEAEWEYACRAGTASDYHAGDSLPQNEARISAARTADAQRPAAVGSYRPNRFGLYDMHGNLWEWCSDWYDKNYYTQSPREDPQGPADGDYHADRGGCWASVDETCRSANRRSDPANRSDILGFRVVLVAPQPERQDSSPAKTNDCP
jgi:formylglycine-generating enzyme required for sulfatase activity